MGKASVNAQRGRLYLLAKLPKKNGDGWTQTRIPMGLADNPANRKVAEKRRVRLQRAIDNDTFDWADWTDDARKGITWKKAIEALYKKRVVLGRTSENTWEINFMGRLRQAPMQSVVTSQGIASFLSRWERDTCSYKEAFYLAKDLCRLIAISFPEVATPTYDRARLKNVPEDHEIIDWISKASPEFAWALGMMATYGLRPAETYKCKFIDDKHRLQVDDDTKTGFRIVVPCATEWVQLFDLRNERKRVHTSTRPDATAQWMYSQRMKIGLPFVPYAFRHSYAGRLWKLGGSRLDLYTAARLMGHTPAEHAKTYRAFIDPVQIAQRAEESLVLGQQDFRNSLDMSPGLCGSDGINSPFGDA